jgi:NAD(P)-dependent dehydrogenase (short-subunit alcohol dehydrogenase family)
VPCDVTDETSVQAMVAEARRRMGAVDVLVNNAGTGAAAPLAKNTVADWNRVLAVNATGTFLCTREVLPSMVERRFGRVVNVASIAGLRGARYVAHYTAAKHAVVGFTRAVACEVDGTGVTVNAVCPGYADTPMTEQTVARVTSRTGLDRGQALAAVLATTGQTRLVSPAEVARAVLELCRPDSGRNGEAVVVVAGSGAS